MDSPVLACIKRSNLKASRFATFIHLHDTLHCTRLFFRFFAGLITSLTRSGFGAIQAIRLAHDLFDPLPPDASLGIAISKVMFQYHQLVRFP